MAEEKDQNQEENKEEEQASEEQVSEEATEEKAETSEEGSQKEQEAQDDSADSQTEESSEEKTQDSSSDDSAEEEVEVPEKFQKIVEEIEQMPVLELNELVKVFEKKFGVSAAAAAAPAGGGGADEGGAEEKSSFDVELASAGDQKVQVIKIVKEVMGVGLKEAKDTAENAPATVKEGADKEEAEDLKSRIEEAGGTVELK